MIKVFKLINGEELISKVSNSYADDSYYTLDRPASIMLQQTQQGVNVGLAPYMPYANSEIRLNKSAIASESTPDVQMENEYNRIFGSGIQIANTMPGI